MLKKCLKSCFIKSWYQWTRKVWADNIQNSFRHVPVCIGVPLNTIPLEVSLFARLDTFKLKNGHSQQTVSEALFSPSLERRDFLWIYAIANRVVNNFPQSAVLFLNLSMMREYGLSEIWVIWTGGKGCEWWGIFVEM